MKAQALALVRGLRFQRPRAPGPAFSPSRPSPMGLRGGKKFLETTCGKAGTPCWAARDPQAGQGLVRPSAGLWEARGRPCCCESTWRGLLSLHGWERTLVAPPCFRPGAQDKGPRSQGGLP